MTPRRLRLVSAAGAAVLLGALVAPGAARADGVRDAQWWLSPLRIAEAQRVSTGEGVTVGVIDTAVDDSRPELRGRVLPGKGHEASDPSDGTNDVAAAEHGTAMASLIAGKSPKGDGFLGVAPGARILPYASNAKKNDAITSGLRWLTDKGAKVINISLGDVHEPQPAEIEAVNYALSHDVVVVVAAGNRIGSSRVATPANIPGVVAVSGVSKTADFSSESSSGPEVVLSAPGLDIVAPAPTAKYKTGYGIADGTSCATAIVSGVAALIRSKYPDMNAANVIERLIRTARDNGAPGRDPQFGFGVVRPVQALTDKVTEVDRSSLASAGGTTDSGGGSTARPQTGTAVEPPPVDGLPSTSEKSSGLPIFAVVGVVLLVVVVLVVVLLARRRRRTPAPVAGWPGPQPGYPPAGGPGPGYPQSGPQGYPPPGGQPPPGYHDPGRR